MESKKGDISITTIVVAAVALIVLIVLIAIFTGRIRLFGDQYDSSTAGVRAQTCNAQPGYCLSEAQRSTCIGSTPGGSWIDCASSEICCVTGTT